MPSLAATDCDRARNRNSLFFPSCKHLTSTNCVLGPVLELRSQGSLHYKNGPGLCQDRNSSLGSGGEAEQVLQAEGAARTKPEANEPTMSKASSKEERGKPVRARTWDAQGTPGTSGVHILSGQGCPAKTWACVWACGEERKGSLGKRVSRQKLEGKDRENRPSRQREGKSQGLRQG